MSPKKEPADPAAPPLSDPFEEGAEFASPPCFLHELDPVYMGLAPRPSDVQVTINAVLVGQLAPLGRRGVTSGMAKKPVAGSVAVHRDGLEGDAQGDRKNHGGPEKAIHHYPFDHYTPWREELAEHRELLAAPGAFGENISTTGLTEQDVCIGDIFRLGTAVVQISQGRQPCWRLNERFGLSDMARRVQTTARTGWYYRVLEEGIVEAGSPLRLLERRAPAWTVARALHLLYRDTMNREALQELAGLAELAQPWRHLAARRLEKGAVEDWSGRLTTPSE
jgi:MOSC domain-containing protein YiiM